MQEKYIFYADRIVSVEHPYIDDAFVLRHHKSIGEEESKKLVSIYKDLMIRNRLLAGILSYAAKHNTISHVHCVDIGVFMGSFSNAISLLSRHMDIPIQINAYEANPSLIYPLIKNFTIYDSEVLLHWNAVGAERRSMELVVAEAGAIGGSLANPNERKKGSHYSYIVDTLPLSECLPDTQDICFIKIDIEGHEVAAFSSIYNNSAMLNNIFVIEFSPCQASQEIVPGVLYSDFLFYSFQVYNIGNWGWFQQAVSVNTADELLNIDLLNSGSNTDLLLIPKDIHIDSILSM
jgi:FkbM family methyltransferase